MFQTKTHITIVEIDGLNYLPKLETQGLLRSLKCVCYCYNLMGPIDETEAAFKGLSSLEELIIYGFTELTCLPEGVLQPTLLTIDIRRCPKLKTLNPIDESEAVFNGLTFLQRLWIYDCPELITLPASVLRPTLISISIHRCPKLKMPNPIDKIAAAFNNLTFLRRLWINDCPELTLPEAAFKGLSSLEELIIYGFTELTCLPEGVLQPTLLKIDIRRCPKLKTLTPIDESKAVNGLTFLRRLWIYDCPELTLPEGAFNSLEELTISGFTELTCLPKGVLQPTLIDIGLLDCPKLKTSDPDALRTLTSLKTLFIKSCSNWGSCWEEGLFRTNSLQTLLIGEFGEEYRYFPWPSTSTSASPPSSHFTSLEILYLRGWPEVTSLPDQLEHLPALRTLEIWNFSGLESLPEWLGKLSSLESLSIRGCPLLVERCEKGIGEDWDKIAHIPSIKIDEEEIQ